MTMASLIYNSAMRDEANGAINFGSDTFYGMLVTNSYTPDKDAHTKRSDVTNEVTGTNYVAGGKACACTVSAVDTANDRVTLTFDPIDWPASVITARGIVYYKRRGGASSADELVAAVTFGADIVSTGGAFDTTATVVRKNNP